MDMVKTITQLVSLANAIDAAIADDQALCERKFVEPTCGFSWSLTRAGDRCRYYAASIEQYPVSRDRLAREARVLVTSIKEAVRLHVALRAA